MSTAKHLLPIDQFKQNAETQADQVYLRQPRDRKVTETTWGDAYEQVLRLAAGFRAMGLEPGDKVALLSENCSEWFISDFALIAAGLISVPIYFTAGEKTISYVLEHSEAKAIIVGKLANPSAAENAIPEGFTTIGMSYDSIPTMHKIVDLIANNAPLQELKQPDWDEAFSITYTSGSTGNPKGVVLTFRNIVFGGRAVLDFVENPNNQRVMSYLPLAHITERALVEYASLYTGGVVSFNESLETFVDDLRNADVTTFISVPRLWMKFQSAVLANLPQKKLNWMLKVPVLSGVVKKKIRRQLGLDNVTRFGSGSAPIAASVLEWYRKLDIEIAEGWGMTETTGLATSQQPFRIDKIGSIGKAVEGLEIKLSEEGEILVRGDAVFKEYYKDEENTKATFTEDGWMRTGDRAALDDEGYFQIIGRVKELFKSGKGKYVAPVSIESLMVENQLIEQICVMGSGMAAPKAVLVLSKEVSAGLSKEAISESLEKTLNSVNSKLEKHERMAGLCVVTDEWTVDNGLLTPTLKIKRNLIEDRYQSMVAAEGQAVVSWEQ